MLNARILTSLLSLSRIIALVKISVRFSCFTKQNWAPLETWPGLCSGIAGSVLNIREGKSVTAGHQSLGEFLRSLRVEARLKLREVEERSGVSNAYLSQLETGKINKPSPHILHKLATVYGFPYDKLMMMAGYLVGPSSPDSGEQPVVPGSRIPTSAIRELSPEEEDAVLNYLEYLRFRRSQTGDKG
jgi:transcriptional regulator with XRE-family HTH domain